MALGDFLARLGGRGEDSGTPEPEAQMRPPTADALVAALEETERLVAGGAVPSPVTARVLRVTGTVRDTIPRLGSLGAGSDRAYAVMATATDYLPEAVGGYLRLPRRFADTRPVDGPKTALMVLVDQLDLLGATMDGVFDAVCRDDANALVAHGRFLSEKFGSRSRGGDLEVAGLPTSSPEAMASSHVAAAMWDEAARSDAGVPAGSALSTPVEAATPGGAGAAGVVEPRPASAAGEPEVSAGAMGAAAHVPPTPAGDEEPAPLRSPGGATTPDTTTPDTTTPGSTTPGSTTPGSTTPGSTTPGTPPPPNGEDVTSDPVSPPDDGAGSDAGPAGSDTAGDGRRVERLRPPSSLDL